MTPISDSVLSVYCRIAQRAGVSERQALRELREAGFRIGDGEFRRIWRATREELQPTESR